jgi:hypothetical protein
VNWHAFSITTTGTVIQRQMIPEQSRADLKKQRQSLLEEIEVLKTHCRLLGEVMVNTQQRLLEEKAASHQRQGNDEAYRVFLHNIYKTEASILSCQGFIQECGQKIRAKEDKLRHVDILLQSDFIPPTTSFHKDLTKDL